MENNNQSKTEPIIERKIIRIGEPEVKKGKTNYTLVLLVLITISLLVLKLQENINWDLVRNTPTVKEGPRFFKDLKSKNYLKHTAVPTVAPPPVIEVEEPKQEMSITNKGNKIQIVPKKQNVKYMLAPGYHLYDSIIAEESRKYKGVKPIVIKAIIEQESNYNPHRKRYEEKWERDYGPSIKRKRHENLEEWKENFHSFGLMQIGYALHKDFCGLKSHVDLYDPRKNIACGIKLYGSCLESGNSETYCIKRYNGSGAATEIYKNEVLGRVARLLSSGNKFNS